MRSFTLMPPTTTFVPAAFHMALPLVVLYLEHLQAAHAAVSHTPSLPTWICRFTSAMYSKAHVVVPEITRAIVGLLKRQIRVSFSHVFIRSDKNNARGLCYQHQVETHVYNTIDEEHCPMALMEHLKCIANEAQPLNASCRSFFFVAQNLPQT